MNIIEAIKSGKRFRRPEKEWRNVVYPIAHFSISHADMLADDWEIEEEKLELSWTQIKDALKRCMPHSNTVPLQIGFKKELGFKE